MEKLFFVRWQDNVGYWMNEAKCSGFVIATAKKVEAFKKAVKEITFSEITEEELAVIKKFLGESGGVTYFWEFPLEEVDEDEDEE